MPFVRTAILPYLDLYRKIIGYGWWITLVVIGISWMPAQLNIALPCSCWNDCNPGQGLLHCCEVAVQPASQELSAALTFAKTTLLNSIDKSHSNNHGTESLATSREWMSFCYMARPCMRLPQEVIESLLHVHLLLRL